MTTVTPELLKKITKNRIFAMVYKRVDGTTGKMVCRFGVKKGLKPKDESAKKTDSSKPKTFVTVFNLQKGEYRAIVIANIINITYQGVIVDLATLAALAMSELLNDRVVMTSKNTYKTVHPRLDQAVALLNLVIEEPLNAAA